MIGKPWGLEVEGQAGNSACSSGVSLLHGRLRNLDGGEFGERGGCLLTRLHLQLLCVPGQAIARSTPHWALVLSR